MNTMLRWSPTRKFHFYHDVDDMFLRFVDGVTDEAVQRPASWLPAAEGRIEDGTYGICEVCGKPIGAERLSAIPWARLCIDDQRRASS